MIVDKRTSSEMLSLLNFGDKETQRQKIKEYIKENGDISHYYYFNEEYSYSRYKTLIGRWELAPFFEQMEEDLIHQQSWLMNTPRKLCYWKPKDQKRLIDWRRKHGFNTDVVWEEWCDGNMVCDGLQAFGENYPFCVELEDWVVVYIINEWACQGFGGIVVWFNKHTYDMKVFTLGEDDGYIFPEETYYEDITSLFPIEKHFICSALNEIHIDSFDTQIAIDKIWKFPINKENRKW